LILLGVPPLGCYNYITPRRAGLSATAGLSCCICKGSIADLMFAIERVMYREIEKNIDTVNNLRRDKYIVEGKLKKYVNMFQCGIYFTFSELLCIVTYCEYDL